MVIMILCRGGTNFLTGCEDGNSRGEDPGNKREKYVSMKTSILGALFLLVVGCASIPPEAPELSAELGKRISAIEDSNIVLLHRFFDQKREEVDRFIEDEWVPEFAEIVFSTPLVSDAWNTIVKENDKEQRLIFLIKMGPRLQKKINEKRVELVGPLDDLERRIETEIRAEYAQARAINSSITSFLLSASEVAENRNRYLELVGITDEKVGKFVDRTDDAVADLLGKAKGAADKVDRAEAFITKMRSIRDSI